MALKSDGCEHIASIVASNSPWAGEYSFTSIPQTYKHLQVIGSVGTDGAQVWCLVHFNGDTTYYNYCSVKGDSVGEYSTVYNGNVTYAYIGYVGAFTPNKTYFEMWIPDYTNGNKLKAGLTMMGSFDNSGNNYSNTMGGLNWNESTAITSITFTADTGSANWMGGAGTGYDTTWDLYGWT